MLDKLIIDPIGSVHSELQFRYETPRQGILAGDKIAEIWLNPHNNFEQAVKDLGGFERLWIIYWFHKSTSWKPLVSPPRRHGKKVGVFASRSPFRPNQIGLSCVKLERIEKLKIYVSECDILDGSPVLDIKPYLPYSDSFPDSATGWVETEVKEIFQVVFEKDPDDVALRLRAEQNVNLKNYAQVQLQFNPKDTSRKRISKVNGDSYILDYQKWQIHFRVSDTEKIVFVINISKKPEPKYDQHI